MPAESGTLDLDLGGRNVVGDCMCTGFDQRRGMLTFAFTTSVSADAEKYVHPETISGHIDISAATDGALINDPMAAEMNSHDTLAQNITLVNTVYSQGTIVQKGDAYDYNVNADISYIPAYPGYDNEFNIPSCYGEYDDSLSYQTVPDEYHNIELLGSSRNIDKYIQLVNPDPDPYFDYNSIMSSTEFGRVYEDYLAEYEKTLTLFENPSISYNSPDTYEPSYAIDKADNILSWSVKLNTLNPTPFNMHDIRSMKILVYNADTLGKNPYYVGQLSDFMSGAEIDFSYNEQLDAGNDAEQQTTAAVSNGDIRVTGTHRDIRTHGQSDSNRIDMVDRMTGRLYADSNDLQNATFMFRFYIDENAPLKEYAHIKIGSIKVVLYNDKDLEIYKYYHLLDAYGAVPCKYYESFI